MAVFVFELCDFRVGARLVCLVKTISCLEDAHDGQTLWSTFSMERRIGNFRSKYRTFNVLETCFFDVFCPIQFPLVYSYVQFVFIKGLSYICLIYFLIL